MKGYLGPFQLSKDVAGPPLTPDSDRSYKHTKNSRYEKITIKTCSKIKYLLFLSLQARIIFCVPCTCVVIMAQVFLSSVFSFTYKREVGWRKTTLAERIPSGTPTCKLTNMLCSYKGVLVFTKMIHILYLCLGYMGDIRRLSNSETFS